MTVSESIQTNLQSDIGVLAIFDPGQLEHRRQESDWWATESNRIAETNCGNAMFVDCRAGGKHRVSFFSEQVPQFMRKNGAHAVISCRTGKLYIAAGEVVPSNDLGTDIMVNGGLYLSAKEGTLNVYVLEILPYSLRIDIEAVEASPTNSFLQSPRAFCPEVKNRFSQ